MERTNNTSEISMINKIKRILFSQSFLYTVLAAIASFVNFVTLIIFGRLFSVEEYGIINTFQVTAANFGVIMMPIQMMLCKEIAAGNSNKVRRDVYITFIIALNTIVLIVMILGERILANYLNIKNTGIYLLYVILVIFNNLFLVFNGVLQGIQHFVLLGIISIVFYVGKLILGIGLYRIGMGAEAVIVAFLSAQIICVSLMIGSIHHETKDSYSFNVVMDKEIIGAYIWSLLLYFIVSLYTNNGDLILGNIYCDKKDIGLYSVAINISKIVYYLVATPTATLLLPKIAKQNNLNYRLKLLIKAEFITIFASSIYALFFTKFGSIVIELLYGQEYKGSSIYLGSCIFCSSIMGGFWIFYQYAIGTSLIKVFTVVSVAIGVIAVAMVIILKPLLLAIPLILGAAMIMTIIIVLLYQLFTEMVYKDYIK